jgi:hypothetical protein
MILSRVISENNDLLKNTENKERIQENITKREILVAYLKN